MNKRLMLSSFLLAVSESTFAHTGVGTTQGFMAGFAHPWLGIDHLLVMFAIGLWGRLLGGKQVWALPLSFLSFMAVGAGLSFAGFALPYAESWVMASVLIFGLVIGFNWQASNIFALCLTAMVGLCHGYVHAAEITVGLAQSDYVLGFLCATVIVQSLGFTAGLLSTKVLKTLRIVFGISATAAVVMLLAA